MLIASLGLEMSSFYDSFYNLFEADNIHRWATWKVVEFRPRECLTQNMDGGWRISWRFESTKLWMSQMYARQMDYI
jgi:hypothetical protein